MSKVKGQKSKVAYPRVYLDYAATAPLDPRVLKVMLPYFGKKFGNPSSIHAEGVATKKALEESRKSVARLLQAHADEIIFTSGGTESNNLALSGVLAAHADRCGLNADRRGKLHVVTTNIEHASILEPLRELEQQGRIEVTYVPVESNGIVKPEKIIAAIRPNTILVSVGYANNEIGTIQPIREISKAIRALNFKTLKLSNFQTRFHSDASQAPLYLDCNVERLGVDLMTLDGHKMYGPKGVGCLYMRRGTALAPTMIGGGQERGLRSTTENVSAIVGFAEAFRIAVAERESESARLKKLRDYFLNHILHQNTKTNSCHSDILQNVGMTGVIINGDMKERLPNNLNISLPGVDTEFLTLKLDAAGIAVSTKSSCLGSEGGSYVVRAMGGDEARALSTLRFTLGRGTRKSHIDYLLARLKRLAAKS